MKSDQEGGLEPYHEELLRKPDGADCGLEQMWGLEILQYLKIRVAQDGSQGKIDITGKRKRDFTTQTKEVVSNIQN